MNETGTAISDFLQSYPWDDFLTITFRQPRTDTLAALRDVGNWLVHDDWGHYTRAFLTAEPHRWSHNLHVHAMAAGAGEMPWDIQECANKRWGYSTVSAVIGGAENVASYCSKYASKWSDGDNYDFFGKW